MNIDNIIMLFKEYFVSLVSPEWGWDLIGINVLLVTFFLFLFKYKIGWLSGVSVRDEIAEKDNPAFGIALGSLFLGFLIIMSAATTGDDVVSYKKELLLMTAYGISGMIMLTLSKLLFDKISLLNFEMPDELRKRNISAAIIDGSNVIATALIIFAYMGWVKGTSLTTVFVVAYGWLISQIVLTVFNKIKESIFKSTIHKNFIEAIKADNKAVAIRYSFYKISVAIAPLVAVSHYKFNETIAYWQATEIFLTTILLSTIYLTVPSLLKKIIIPNVDFKDEINNQQNIGLAFIEGCIVLGLAILSYGLLK